MKKIIALLLALACFGTSVFALPENKAVSLDKQVQMKSNVESKSKSSNGSILNTITAEDDLFAAVDAPQLTKDEAQAVEGEGLWGAFFGAIAGAIIGGITNGPSGAAAGAAAGATIGGAFPVF